MQNNIVIDTGKEVEEFLTTAGITLTEREKELLQRCQGYAHRLLDRGTAVGIPLMRKPTAHAQTFDDIAARIWNDRRNSQKKENEMSKRPSDVTEERLRSLYEKLYAADGKYMEIVRRRDLERKDVFELENAARLRAQEPGQQPNLELEAKFAERLARARERLAQFNRRFTEIGEEKMQLVRLKERCETYLLNAAYALPDDELGTVRDMALVAARGGK